MSIFNDFKTASRGNAAPVTTGLVVAIVACFVLMWMKIGPTIFGAMAFDTVTGLSRPWSFITYPFIGHVGPNAAIEVVFVCMWLWGIGGSVERDLKPAKYLGVWFIFSVLCASALLIAALLLHIHGDLYGAWIPVSAITVIWGTRNPTATILLMFVIPIQGKWLAWLSAALVFFSTEPQLAPFAAAPLFLAYLFAANKIPFALYTAGYAPAAKKTERYNKSYYEEVRKREKEREDRDRLRKLFEDSVNDDKNDR
jgi:membrane associated rhomboid family serine protease